MRIAMVSGCELGIVADRLLSLVGDDDRGALNQKPRFCHFIEWDSSAGLKSIAASHMS